jgi:alpha-L-fucosidase
VRAISAAPGSKIYLLGDEKPLTWSQDGADLKISLPTVLTGKYAYALKIEGPVS